MILGLGIDIQDMKRLDDKKIERLAKKIFSESEMEAFSDIKTDRRKKEFLAGHFCSKEAFYKATGKGIRDHNLRAIKIYYDENGKPGISIPEDMMKHYFKNTVQCQLSISHDGDYSVAVVLVESLE